MAIKQTTNQFGKKEMSIEIDRLIEMLEVCVKEGDTHVRLVTGPNGAYTFATCDGENSRMLSVLITNENQM